MKNNRTTLIPLTQERVLQLFDYRLDGMLIRKIKAGINTEVGGIAGSRDHRGRLRVVIDGKRYYAHIIVWLFHNGYFPEHKIDHIDRNPSNNRIENLREVTQSCNLRNAGLRSDNVSGVKGVCAYGDKWKAQIMVFGRCIYLGDHASFLEAVYHRLAAEQCLGWGSCDSSSPAYQYVKNYLEAVA